jgi:hypothetical protein
MASDELVVSGGQGITVVTAAELGAEMTGEAVAVPPGIQGKAKQWLDRYKVKLAAQTEKNLARLSEEVAPQAGEIHHAGYLYWDVVTISPIQFGALPPYQPSRIIASGEVALLLAVMFINPGTDFNNPISATTILGGRRFRVRFEHVNLTDVTNGPDITFTGVFPAPAPSLVLFPAFILAPNPGQNPRLVELNVTADIVDMAQPFAAFATHHLDIDTEPGFLGIPEVGPELQHDFPLRYLIYPK